MFSLDKMLVMFFNHIILITYYNLLVTWLITVLITNKIAATNTSSKKIPLAISKNNPRIFQLSTLNINGKAANNIKINIIIKLEIDIATDVKCIKLRPFNILIYSFSKARAIKTHVMITTTLIIKNKVCKCIF